VPQWETFVALTGVVLTLFLALARASQRVVDESPDSSQSGSGATDRRPRDERRRSAEIPTFVPPDRDREGRTEADPRTGPVPEVSADIGATVPPDTDARGGVPASGHEPTRDHSADGAGPVRSGPGGTRSGDPTAVDLSTGTLLVNVALTQGVFGAILLAAAWYTQVPVSAFGVTADPLSTGLPAVVVGGVLGVALYAVNELGAASADAMGVEYDERLRSMLAPDSAGGWIVLLVLVLPLIAGIEEFIFRAAAIGATATGLGVSPWLLAVISSLAFALGHGAQGRVGVVVTGSLGFVLAAAFILTGSFLVVFVAHYLVNALEFVVHELLGIDWVGD